MSVLITQKQNMSIKDSLPFSLYRHIIWAQKYHSMRHDSGTGTLHLKADSTQNLKSTLKSFPEIKAENTGR